MAYTTTATRSATVTATETRVRAVLRQVNVDLLAAVAAGLVARERTDGWYDDLVYMLKEDALQHFEIRVRDNGTLVAAWRYEVSNDGSLTLTDRGGGLSFYGFSRTATVSLVIQRRPGVGAEVTAAIDRLGWTVKVESLEGALTRERSYSKDGFGVVRNKIGVS